MKRNALSEIESFFRSKLKVKLHNDLRQFRITKEADVECCIYYHLRKTLPATGPWRVLARKYARRTEHYVDLLIFKNRLPRIAVEIKWNKKQINKKDRESLNRALNGLGVNKAYFFSVGPNISKTTYKPLTKREGEKYRLHEVRVGLRLSNEPTESEIEAWRKERDRYGRRMRRGKAKRKSA